MATEDDVLFEVSTERAEKKPAPDFDNLGADDDDDFDPLEMKKPSITERLSNMFSRKKIDLDDDEEPADEPDDFDDLPPRMSLAARLGMLFAKREKFVDDDLDDLEPPEKTKPGKFEPDLDDDDFPPKPSLMEKIFGGRKKPDFDDLEL